MNPLKTVKSLIKDVGDPLFFPLTRWKLQKQLRNASSAEELIDLAFSFRAYGWYRTMGPYQVREEIIRLGEKISAAAPRTMLEIGTAAGGTLLLWCRLVQDCVISLDFPVTETLGGYPKKRMKFYQCFTSGKKTQLHLLYRDSHQKTTVRAVQEILGSRCMDFLFIDGDHTENGCRLDFELYKELVTPGGLVAFHDIVEHTAGLQASAVNQVWGEIKKRYRHEEIIAQPNLGWGGIGLVYL